jgi:hypothetical protein
MRSLFFTGSEGSREKREKRISRNTECQTYTKLSLGVQKCLVLIIFFEDKPVLKNYTYHVVYYLHTNSVYCIVVNNILVNGISLSSSEGI